MRRFVLFAALLAAPFFTAAAQNFVTAQWYWTKLQVISSEGREPDSEDGAFDTISYAKKIWQINFICTYGFHGGKLDAVYFTVDDENYTMNQMLAILRREYGEPVSVDNPVQRILSWRVPRGEILMFPDNLDPGFSLFPHR
ncbi:hypothetical protein AGMMS49928_15680 [Spirochaetia bacterium]|nr:hypothetical protein AGMMS49928_15680 [Spirochaetia bacterium]